MDRYIDMSANTHTHAHVCPCGCMVHACMHVHVRVRARVRPCVWTKRCYDISRQSEVEYSCILVYVLLLTSISHIGEWKPAVRYCWTAILRSEPIFCESTLLRSTPFWINCNSPDISWYVCVCDVSEIQVDPFRTDCTSQNLQCILIAENHVCALVGVSSRVRSCVCVLSYVCVCVRVCLFVCPCVRTYVCVHTFLCVSTYNRPLSKCALSHVPVCLGVHVSEWACAWECGREEERVRVGGRFCQTDFRYSRWYETRTA